MYIPKSVLLGLLFVSAGLFGWVLHSLVDDDPAPLAATPVSVESPVEQPEAEGQGDTIVNLTIAGATPQTISLAPGAGSDAADASAQVAGTAPVAGTARTSTAAHGSSGAGEATAGRSSGASDDGDQASSAPSGEHVAGRVGGVWALMDWRWGAAQPTSRDLSVSMFGGDRRTQAQVQDVAVSAIGDHIVIAYDDSIVFIGDDGRLTANTGDASSSGTVALDVAGSALTSGNSSTGVPATSTRSTTIVGDAGTVRTTTGGIDLGAGAGGRAVSIAGFEDHSLDVAGRDNVVTYDDSNVFIARNGQINTNTGDTDSSGLNVVDAKRSVVRSGDHSDDGDGDDDGEEPEEPEEPEEEELVAQGSAPATSPAGATTAPATSPAGARATASVTDDDGGTTASGDEALAIGGDGYDDLGVDVAGERNTVTYDDSNVVIGGTGGVNAQIGDSDTGGAVVMGVEDSVIEGGRSN